MTPQIDCDEFGNASDEDDDACNDTDGRSERIAIQLSPRSAEVMCKQMEDLIEAEAQEGSSTRPRDLACGVANCVIS